ISDPVPLIVGSPGECRRRVISGMLVVGDVSAFGLHLVEQVEEDSLRALPFDPGADSATRRPGSYQDTIFPLQLDLSAAASGIALVSGQHAKTVIDLLVAVFARFRRCEVQLGAKSTDPSRRPALAGARVHAGSAWVSQGQRRAIDIAS